VPARAHVPRAAAEPSGAAGQGQARPPPRPPAPRLTAPELRQVLRQVKAGGQNRSGVQRRR